MLAAMRKKKDALAIGHPSGAGFAMILGVFLMAGWSVSELAGGIALDLHQPYVAFAAVGGSVTYAQQDLVAVGRNARLTNCAEVAEILVGGKMLRIRAERGHGASDGEKNDEAKVMSDEAHRNPSWKRNREFTRELSSADGGTGCGTRQLGKIRLSIHRAGEH